MPSANREFYFISGFIDENMKIRFWPAHSPIISDAHTYTGELIHIPTCLVTICIRIIMYLFYIVLYVYCKDEEDA